MTRQADEVFDATEQFIGERDFGWAVHLRLDDVHRAGARVALALLVVLGNQAGDHAVHDPFGNLVTFAVDDRRVGHQVTDVADEQQRAAVQLQAGAIGRGVFAILVETAGDALAALLQIFDQIAFHQAQPVAVDQHLVVGIDRGGGVLAVHDGGDGGFDQQILDAGGIGLADGAVRIDLDLDVQAVVLQQDRGRLDGLALIADELLGLLQPGDAAVFQGDLEPAVLHAVADRLGMAAFSQRRGLIEEVARKGDDLGTAHFVIARPLLRAVLLADGVGAVERVIQRAPAGVGGV